MWCSGISGAHAWKWQKWKTLATATHRRDEPNYCQSSFFHAPQLSFSDTGLCATLNDLCFMILPFKLHPLDAFLTRKSCNHRTLLFPSTMTTWRDVERALAVFSQLLMIETELQKLATGDLNHFIHHHLSLHAFIISMSVALVNDICSTQNQVRIPTGIQTKTFTQNSQKFPNENSFCKDFDLKHLG